MRRGGSALTFQGIAHSFNHIQSMRESPAYADGRNGSAPSDQASLPLQTSKRSFFLFVASPGKLNPSLFPGSVLSNYFSAMPIFSHFEKVREILEMTLPKPVSFTSPEEIHVSS